MSGTPCTHRADKGSGQFFILEDGSEEKLVLKETHSWYTNCAAGEITDWRLIHRDVA